MGNGEQSMERLREEIEKWRNTRENRCAMPEGLWQQAVKMAKSHGVQRVSKKCNLHYNNLKKRLQANLGKGSESGAEDDISFVELEGMNLEALKARSAAVTVQVIDERGASMKVEYWDREGFDMGEAMQYFWSRGQCYR